MGRIVAISSGHMDDLYSIHAYIVDGSKKKHVLFIPTASENSESYIQAIEEMFGKLECQVESLCLPEDFQNMDTLLEWADIIYVGGGDTLYMMDVWKQFGLDKKLIEIYEKDSAILSGISAGAMCWFQYGHSENDIFEEGYGLVKGLNLHEYIYCPHYEERVDSFNHMMQGKSVPGLALETNTAFVENNGDIWFISTDSSKNVYTIKEGKKVKEKIWKL